VGGGIASFTGGFSNRLSAGWHGDVGAGWNVTKAFSLSTEYSYSGGFGVSREVLVNTFAPVASAGSMHVWSLAAEPRLKLGTYKHLSPYLVGGLGYYHRRLDFTPLALPPSPFPVRPTPSGTDKYLGILNDSEHGGIGGNLGAGLSFPLHRNLSAFAEARYHDAHTGGLGAFAMHLVPVTFGIRF
jgi:opacity protein-like surface antigen